jgi:hypothetical protein
MSSWITVTFSRIGHGTCSFARIAQSPNILLLVTVRVQEVRVHARARGPGITPTRKMRAMDVWPTAKGPGGMNRQLRATVPIRGVQSRVGVAGWDWDLVEQQPIYCSQSLHSK